jgi:hypothetical protein
MKTKICVIMVEAKNYLIEVEKKGIFGELRMNEWMEM